MRARLLFNSPLKLVRGDLMEVVKLDKGMSRWGRWAPHPPHVLFNFSNKSDHQDSSILNGHSEIQINELCMVMSREDTQKQKHKNIFLRARHLLNSPLKLVRGDLVEVVKLDTEVSTLY